MYKTISVKIKNPDSYFNKIFLEAKYLYNHILSQEDVFSYDTKKRDIFVKKEEIEPYTISYLSSQMVQGIYQRICDNIKGLSVRKKKSKVGRLKFISKLNSVPLKNQTLKIKESRMIFQKHKKSYRFSGRKQIPENGLLKSALILRKPSGIYVNLIYKIEPNYSFKSIVKKVIGLDMGIKEALTFNDGTKLSYVSDLSSIKTAHKNLSRKVKGSKNYYKQKIILEKAYEREDNKKKDVVNKIINKLNNYKICFQDEMISNWHKGLFGKQVQHSILGRLKSALKQNPDNLILNRTEKTTKLCTNCGTINNIGLGDRIYSCECGYTKDRDAHSANNMIVMSGLEQASVEIELDLYSILKTIQSKHLSLKQEANVL